MVFRDLFWLYAIDMGRDQKLRNPAGKTVAGVGKGHPSKAHSKRQEALKAATAAEPSVLDRGEKLSRDSVAAHALATFGSPEKAQHWMNRPNPLFHGKAPAQVIEFDLVGVEAELVRIDHGVYM